jgi:hypothetical protein
VGSFSSSLIDPVYQYTVYGSGFFDTPTFEGIAGQTEYRIPFVAEIRLGLAKSPNPNDPDNIPVEVLLLGGGFAVPEIEVFTIGNGLVTYNIVTVEYQFAAIPEPASLTLSLGALAIFASVEIRRRRRRL